MNGHDVYLAVGTDRSLTAPFKFSGSVNLFGKEKDANILGMNALIQPDHERRQKNHRAWPSADTAIYKREM
jgi:hypothetical protein